MFVRRVVAVAAVVALGTVTAVAAQNPPQAGRRGPRANRPEGGQQAAPAAQQPAAQAPAAAGAQQAGGGAARYLAEHPDILNLTPVQQQRIRKLAAREDSANAPLRAQMHELTRGQQVRDMPPAERRRAAPQIRNVMQQMHANDEAGLDSVAAVLTPEQATRLETVREDFKARREARRAALQPRIDSARARTGARPPRP